ncbi:pectinesterase 2-like [Cynara cardunculus var. scolymus]|uniref:pectinesterase 2-like n=1 Tax=Cynara cardunculus var. scolymus TaxID=59895 RepID=UPI000D623835|nr:pectinesterase 2-like [Cynara cardunculus var. scolymus]
MVMKLPLFICFIVTFTFSCSSETTFSGNIKWWCGQTPHYQTCDYYLSHRNFSTIASLSTTEFLEMSVQVAIDEALVVRKRAHEIESKYPNVPGKGLWSSCVDYFDAIVFTLNSVFDRNLDPLPLDIQTWISAAFAYINACEEGFELINMTNTILPAISSNLTELILNSLAISVVYRGRNTPGFVDWNYPNEYKLSNNLASNGPNVVVAQDGSGDFTTVQAAVNAAANRAQPMKRFVIYVKAGTYTENVVIPDEVGYITMYGDGIGKTIITGSRHAGGDALKTTMAGDLKSTATIQVWGREFIARDMTFRNTAGPYAGQALAFFSVSDQSVLYHCSFEGYQDTLYACGNKQFYKECQIYGTVDFIFGDAAAVFQDCGIFLRRPRPGGGLVVTANGRKSHNESSGYSLQGCKITAGDDLKPVIGQYKKAFLGRPWGAYAKTVFMENYLDDLIDPQGWMDSWGNKDTCYCGEYKNYGPGSSTANRVKWRSFHKITNQKSARRFTVGKLLSGNHWLPKTGVPYIAGFEN